MIYEKSMPGSSNFDGPFDPLRPPIFDNIFRLKHSKFDGESYKSDSAWCQITKIFRAGDFVSWIWVSKPPFLKSGRPTVSNRRLIQNIYTYSETLFHQLSNGVSFIQIGWLPKKFSLCCSQRPYIWKFRVEQLRRPRWPLASTYFRQFFSPHMFQIWWRIFWKWFCVMGINKNFQ